MAPAIQAARETFDEAKSVMAHSFAIPTGNAQAQLTECDLACCREIVAAQAIRDAGQRRDAIKGALAAASVRRQRMAAEDAEATVKRNDRDAACRRVLEERLGHTIENGFATLAVLADAEREQLAALDCPDCDVAAAQAIVDAAAERLAAAAAAPPAAPTIPTDPEAGS